MLMNACVKYATTPPKNATRRDVPAIDITADPFQLTNLLGDGNVANDPDPLTQAELSQELADYRSCAGSDCP